VAAINSYFSSINSNTLYSLGANEVYRCGKTLARFALLTFISLRWNNMSFVRLISYFLYYVIKIITLFYRSLCTILCFMFMLFKYVDKKKHYEYLCINIAINIADIPRDKKVDS